MCNFIEKHFIWIIVAFSSIAIIYPPIFTGLKPFIPVLLGIIMFGIGVTLNASEFQRTLEKKWLIAIVIIIKYVLMPLIAYLIGLLLKLSLLELVGLVIVGACPGGTAANVMAYLGKGNTTLTVILTLGTTLIAPFVTPALIYFFLHKSISIPFFEILNTMALVVLLPIAVGVIIKKILVRQASVM